MLPSSSLIGVAPDRRERFQGGERQLEGKRLAGEQVTRDYLAHFTEVGERIDRAASADDWSQIYLDMVTWGMDLFAYSDHGLLETQAEQAATYPAASTACSAARSKSPRCPKG